MNAVYLISECDIKVICVKANHKSQMIQTIKMVAVMVVVHNVGRMMIMSMVIMTTFIMCVTVAMATPIIIAIF